MTSKVLVEEVSRIVSEITGVQLGHRQTAMVESRLTRRMLQLGITSADEYLGYVRNNQKNEVAALVSLLTTHHTHFFREFSHFEYLGKSLPSLVAAARARKQTTLDIWCAACSRGQEVYSLSMFLSHELKQIAPEMGFQIFGSDVDPESVAIARNGVYRWDDIKSIPAHYLAKHWMRGTGEIADFVKAKDSIKSPCSFGVINLLDFSKEMTGKLYDVIFCRNVFIYFTPEQINQSTSALLRHLHPHGLFFVGISESLNGSALPVQYLAPSVYGHKSATATRTKPDLRVVPSSNSAVASPAATVTAAAATAPLRVLCVDDSPTILTLLKKILTRDSGFDVVATAVNGIDATEKLKQHKIDIMTLDIHMPEQTGIEYLEKNMGPNHPPVVMITSVSRENAALGVRSLELGALDYIEKPGLSDLQKRSDEIRMKLKYAVTFAKTSTAAATDLTRSFKHDTSVASPQSKLNLIFAAMGDRAKLGKLLKDLSFSRPPTVVFVQGGDAFLEPLAKSLQNEIGGSVRVLSSAIEPLNLGTIYLADHASVFPSFQLQNGTKAAGIMIFGDVTAENLTGLAWKNAEYIIEEGGPSAGEMQKKFSGHSRRLVPYTSFAYHSTEFLSGTSTAKAG